jgi:biotin operon repressor
MVAIKINYSILPKVPNTKIDAMATDLMLGEYTSFRALGDRYALSYWSVRQLVKHLRSLGAEITNKHKRGQGITVSETEQYQERAVEKVDPVKQEIGRKLRSVDDISHARELKEFDKEVWDE